MKKITNFAASESLPPPFLELISSRCKFCMALEDGMMGRQCTLFRYIHKSNLIRFRTVYLFQRRVHSTHLVRNVWTTLESLARCSEDELVSHGWRVSTPSNAGLHKITFHPVWEPRQRTVTIQRVCSHSSGNDNEHELDRREIYLSWDNSPYTLSTRKGKFVVSNHPVNALYSVLNQSIALILLIMIVTI